MYFFPDEGSTGDTTVASRQLIGEFERWHAIVLFGALAGVLGGVALGATVGVEYGVAAFLVATAGVVVALATWKGLDLARTNV